MSDTLTLEDRLARYRPTLDAAVSARNSLTAKHVASADLDLSDVDLIDIDQEQPTPGRMPPSARFLMAAAVIGLVVGVGAVLATRGTSTIDPADSPAAPDTPAVDTAVVDATAPAEIIEGSGRTPACPPETEGVTTDTLYLGGPAWEQNLAAAGFILSLPSGTAPVDVAVKAIGGPILGDECSITARPNDDGSNVSVSIEPPAVPTALHLDVALSERDGAVGVTSITGNLAIRVTDAGTSVPGVELLGGIPDGAATVDVRFKKGDDVWFLGGEPAIGTKIALDVPAGETDRFPDEPVDWVLLVVRDANERVVGVAAQIVA